MRKVSHAHGTREEEVDHFLERHLMIVPLFDIDVITLVGPYISELVNEEKDISLELDLKSLEELWHA